MDLLFVRTHQELNVKHQTPGLFTVNRNIHGIWHKRMPKSVIAGLSGPVKCRSKGSKVICQLNFDIDSIFR